jgi:hypothetical protein
MITFTAPLLWAALVALAMSLGRVHGASWRAVALSLALEDEGSRPVGTGQSAGDRRGNRAAKGVAVGTG